MDLKFILNYNRDMCPHKYQCSFIEFFVGGIVWPVVLRYWIIFLAVHMYLGIFILKFSVVKLSKLILNWTVL